MIINIHKSKGIYRGDLIRSVKVRGFIAHDAGSVWEQADGTFVTVIDEPFMDFRLDGEGDVGYDADFVSIFPKERD